ncbi:hypothetical protein OAA40_00405 [bacterium]|nr:hypothetical protein [bacterium]|tara:strand:+ start:250 stop:648 length:399 start_codon:yes stop_codon:yes gene_type:complete
MAAGRYSFVIEQGATLDFEIAYTDASGNAIDLTNHSGRMQIKDSYGSSTTHITLSSSISPDGTGLNFSGSNNDNSPVSGTIGIFISANSSSLLNFSEAVYDLEIVSGSTYPVVTRVLEGKIRLSKEVTTGNY